MAENGENIKKSIILRMNLVLLTIGLLGFVIVGKVLYLQYGNSGYWKKQGLQNHVFMDTIRPMRGNILSADGMLLATSIPIYDLYMDCQPGGSTDAIFNEYMPTFCDSLALILRIDARLLETKLIKGRNQHRRYINIARDISFHEAKRIKNTPFYKLGKNKSGLMLRTKERRLRPYPLLANRTIGSINIFSKKYVGLEAAYDKVLTGQVVVRPAIRVTGGIMPLADESDEPEHGKDLLTCLDVNIQDITETALLKSMIYNDADHGCAVVMEVATGNIVAMANLTRKEVGNYIDADKNYAVSGCGSVEPGSTFKLASLLVAFDKGIATPNDLVDITGGRARFGNTILLDSEGHKNGIVTLQEAFEVSSNIGIAKAIVPKLESLKLQQEFLDGFRILGIDQPTDIDLLGEKKPRFKSTKDATWNRKVDMSRVLIGYSSEMTPLQVLTFYNAIANEGNMVKPRLVRKIMQYNNQVKAFETSYIKKNICSAQSLQQAKKLLLGVTSRGTGKSIQDSLKFKVAGKTGTTKLLVNGSYSDKYQASFVGYFPAEKPKYSVIVVVNNPSKGRVYGAQVAGPVFKEIAQKLYASKIATEEPKQLVAHDPGNFLSSKAGYRPMVETVFDHFGLLYHEGEMYEWGAYRSGNVYSFDKLKLNMAVMPNLNGMGLQDALYLLDRRRVRYKVSGRGKVIKQSVEPGTSIKEVSMVYLELG